MKKLEVIDFYASWCVNCRLLDPVFNELIMENKSKRGLIIRKKDVDISLEAVDKYDIMAVPMIIMEKDGKVVERIHGVRTKDQLQDLIDKYYEENETIPQDI